MFLFCVCCLNDLILILLLIYTYYIYDYINIYIYIYVIYGRLLCAELKKKKTCLQVSNDATICRLVELEGAVKQRVS